MVARKLSLIFLGLVSSSIASQGALSLLDSCDFAGEIWISSKSKRATVEAKVILRIKGPLSKRIRLAFHPFTSAHIKPMLGRKAVVFLSRLRNGSFALLQKNMALVPSDSIYAVEWLETARRLRALKSPRARLEVLAKGLESRFDEISLACAEDLYRFNGLLKHATPSLKQDVLRAFRRFPPGKKQARLLLHVIGTLKPDSWEKEIIGKLESLNGFSLAVDAGRVLGSRGASMLMERLKRNFSYPLALALCHTNTKKALRFLEKLLKDEKKYPYVVKALATLPGPGSAELLGRSLDRCLPFETERARTIIHALSRMDTIFARRILDQVASGKRAPAFSGIAGEKR